MREFVSKINIPRWHDPFTGCGVRLATVSNRMESAAFQVHEAGRMELTAEWCYTRVCSPFWRLYHCAQPGAAVRVGGQRIDLMPDMILFLPPLVVFDCLPSPGVDHLWVHFSMPLKVPQLRNAGMQKLSPAMSTLADRMRFLIGIEASPERLRHTTMALLHSLWSERSDNEDEGPLSPRLEQVFELVESSLSSPPNLKTLAVAAGMSAGAFIRWFKEEVGTTPAAFVVRRRVIEACRLLRYSEVSIETVAESTGFTNRYHFTRVFSREVGVSPGAFRNRCEALDSEK